MADAHLLLWSRDGLRGPRFVRANGSSASRSRARGYVQIVENRRDGAVVRKRGVVNLGLAATEPLLRSSPRAPSSPTKCC